MYYNLFGELANQLDDVTLISGRASLQRHSEILVVKDIIEKLDIKNSDKVLEIGCGVGVMLFPISIIAEEVYGIDHPLIISKLMQMSFSNNCKLIAGEWLQDEFNLPKVSKILIYSVIHYMTSFDHAVAFIEKALKLLQPGGKLLIGDIPNRDKKNRFKDWDHYEAFTIDWNNKREQFKSDEEVKRDELVHVFKESNPIDLIDFDDDLILDLLKHFRMQGYEVYLLPQPSYLPFGNTREDLIILKR